MASYTKHFSFVENLAEKKFDLGADTLIYALTANGSAPTTANTQLSDLSQISYTNLTGRTITTSSSAQTSGTYKLVLADTVITAGGGAGAAFRYADLYSDTSTNDLLVMFIDYGSALTLNDGETLTIDHDASAGVLTLA
jgi:hypothetical protein